MFRSKLKSLILATAVSLLALSLIAFPQESVAASIRGLNMWLEIVFPSLFPFFVISEMLIGFGVVKFIGVLLEPFMRPLFRVPGAGGFVLAMGMASGFPSGAKLTARLRQEGQLTKLEAERLASFTNSSNPLFIFGAVSVGFFENPKLGIILAAAHYLGNITVGFIMRFYGKEKFKKDAKRIISIKSAFAALHQTRIEDNRPIGKLLGDAVMSSVQTLLMIGGFIILFSVLNQLLFLLHLIPLLSKAIILLFQVIRMPEDLSIPFISGIFEITLGSQLISNVEDALLIKQAILTSLILGFSGLSVHAQVASILAQTDIKFKPFFIARIMQGGFAAFYTLILWNPLYEGVFLPEQPAEAVPATNFQQSAVQWSDIGALVTIAALAVYVWIYARRMVFTKKS
nr:sporulation integral membrane protein YlbJ [uncultured Bacillus sp.]